MPNGVRGTQVITRSAGSSGEAAICDYHMGGTEGGCIQGEERKERKGGVGVKGSVGISEGCNR